jgi:hypothetical protein
MSNGIARIAQVVVCTLVWLAFVLPSGVRAQAPVERLSVPGPLLLDGQAYHFAWSSHPAPHFYKQEYLPAGQALPRYRQMLMLDLLVADATPVQLAQSKIAELEARKQDDPLVQHDVIAREDGSAVLLDFVLSAPDADGGLIVEWNAYRYERVADGVLLFGISRRAYGMDNARRFLGEEVRQHRARWIEELAGLALPAIAIRAPAPP